MNVLLFIMRPFCSGVVRSVIEHLFITYQWVLKENSYLALRFSIISGLFITLQCKLEWSEWTYFDVFMFIIVVLFILY